MQSDSCGKARAQNQHIGKQVKAHVGGVEIELIIVEYEKNSPKVVCMDTRGTKYRLLLRQVKGTGERISFQELTKMIANNLIQKTNLEGVTKDERVG